MKIEMYECTHAGKTKNYELAIRTVFDFVFKNLNLDKNLTTYEPGNY